MTTTHAQAKTAALEVFRACRVKPTTQVGYRSSGQLLIVGDSDAVFAVVSRLSGALKTRVLLTDVCPDELARRLAKARTPYLDRCRDIEIRGYLGAFRVSLDSPAAEAFFAAGDGFDLVLDLETPPLHTPPIPPPGYYAPAGDPRRLEEALLQLPEMTGEFDKPKFFDFKPSLCAHSANGLAGCRQCIDGCPTGAIASDDGVIRVNPYLCQGCGDCATVCPSGAMSYAFPSRADTINRLRLMLKAYFGAGGDAPILLLHDADTGRGWVNANPLPERMLHYEIEALGAAGPEIWLSALAYGAAGVLLLEAVPSTEQTRQSLKAQILYAGEILAGLGFPAAAVTLADAQSVSRPQELAFEPLPAIPPAQFAGTDEKRSTIRMAVDHLWSRAPAPQEIAILSEGAPFGAIAVDRERCTLCMACVSTCPAGALAGGGDRPQLKFIEANCVQCGLCRIACPEKAVELISRFRYDSVQAHRAELLHEDALHACVECGKPFATRSMIRAILGKVENHPMFQGGNRRRLMMCEACRVKAMF